MQKPQHNVAVSRSATEATEGVLRMIAPYNSNIEVFLVHEVK